LARCHTPLSRWLIAPNDENGRRERAGLMVAKINTVRKDRLGAAIIQFDNADIVGRNQAVQAFLRMAGAPRRIGLA